VTAKVTSEKAASTAFVKASAAGQLYDRRMRALAAVASVSVVFLGVGCGGAHTKTFRVPSSAMEPTLHCARPGSGCTAAVEDRIVVDESSRDLKRGDIVVFDVPSAALDICGAGGKYVKRVIGLPGAVWQERRGFVYINGRKLNEPYVKKDRRDFESWPARRIPKGNYFMMGDNRQSSCDSRRWGTVPAANLVGKVTRIEHPG
jgi:signal peptidase I